MASPSQLLPASLERAVAPPRDGEPEVVDAALRRAVFASDRAAAERALAAGADVRALGDHGWSALAIAHFVGDGVRYRELVTVLNAAATAAGARAAPADDAPSSPALRRGQIAGSSAAPVRVQPPLPPGGWELRLALSANGTVNGTCNQPALVLSSLPSAGGAPLCAEVVVSQVTASGTAGRAFSARMPLRPGSTIGEWSTPPVSGLLDLREMAIAPVDPLTGKRLPLTAADGGAGGLCLDWMTFPGGSMADFRLRFAVRLVPAAAPAAVAAGGGGGGSDDAPPTVVGTAELSPILLTGVSTAHVGPTSAGLENIQHDDLAGGQVKRLAGQLALPLVAALPPAVGDAAPAVVVTTGYVTLRYLFVRGYSPPSAAAPAPLSGSAEVASTVTGAGTAHVLAPARAASPSVSYWDGKRTRLFGHRGSGADNSALVVTADPDPEGGTSPPPAAAPVGAPLARSLSAVTTSGVTSVLSSGSVASLAPSSSGAGEVIGGEAVATSPPPPQVAQQPAPGATPLLSPTGSVATQASGTSTTGGGSGSGGGRAARLSRRVHMPENTLLSLSTAATTGAELVEFDVQLTRDGVPVIHHDWGVLLPGPAAVRVPVTHLTLAQFKSLQPQVMVNDERTNEYALARAADAAAMRRLVMETHERWHICGHAKPPTPTAAGASVAGPPQPAPSLSGSGRPPRVQPRAGAGGHRSRSTESPGAGGGSGWRSLDTTDLPSYSGGGGGDTAATASGAPLPLSPISAGLQYYYGLHDRFTTLAELLARVPAGTGFNIEMKYPTVAEAGMFGLRPWERNAFVDRVLDVVFAFAAATVSGSADSGGDGSGPHPPAAAAAAAPRTIMFSSFDPDVCLLLARKQAAFPVFLLTEGGTAEPPYFDLRWNSLAGAVAFARAAGLFGVVTDVTPLLACPSLIPVVQEEAGLVLCSYGRANNDAAAVTTQQRWGIGAVIADHVAHIARTLRSAAAAGTSTAGGGSGRAAPV